MIYTPKAMQSPQQSPRQRDLVLAVIAGDIDAVTSMYNMGVSITAPDQYGWLPIHRAAANDRDEIINLLIRWGSPLEEKGTEDWTALHLAAVSRSPRAVSALIRAGANIHARSISGATPLHLAIGPTISEDQLHTVKVLVDAGADLNAIDDKGVSPLAKAREIANEQLLRILKND